MAWHVAPCCLPNPHCHTYVCCFFFLLPHLPASMPFVSPLYTCSFLSPSSCYLDLGHLVPSVFSFTPPLVLFFPHLLPDLLSGGGDRKGTGLPNAGLSSTSLVCLPCPACILIPVPSSATPVLPTNSVTYTCLQAQAVSPPLFTLACVSFQCAHMCACVVWTFPSLLPLTCALPF